MIENYGEQVYAAVLGKVIGVYMGRPFEGWSKKDIEARWGAITRYVNHDCGVPLVVADDDISGTFTFIRALVDSGLYENTPPAFFGDTWLNYLLEGQTILWWGGMSLSTEHTAFLRLKQGVKAPHSGSMQRNGKKVAEQIGAQIFIDAFGMVAPGNPRLAAALAANAARVSHDGEAVHAAQVVAAMVSAAFTCKRMDAVLDQGVAVIPPACLIAHIHRDVRAWAAADNDWRATFDRIDAKYGYATYGGNCHIVPNHALMVMAWAYAKENFFEAQRIINTAGWDTDCNAANVGTVSALVCGLHRICDHYDFRTPFADRLLIPTAEGTHSVSDCLRESLAIAAIGRKVMKLPALPPPKDGAHFHFSLPGALQGFMPGGGTVHLSATAHPDLFAGAHCLRAECSATAGNPAWFATPVAPVTPAAGYTVLGTPLLYNGMTLRVRLLQKPTAGSGTLRLFLSTAAGHRLYSGAIPFAAPAAPVDFAWRIDTAPDTTFETLGFEFRAAAPASAEFCIDRISLGGDVLLRYASHIPHKHAKDFTGWISSLDAVRGAFSDEPEALLHILSNSAEKFLVTGNRFWRHAVVSCRFCIHAAHAAGLVVRYQGAERYYAASLTKTSLRLLLRHYGEKVLAEIPCTLPEDTLIPLSLSAQGHDISVRLHNREVIRVHDPTLSDGAAGFLVRLGMAGMRDIQITAQTTPH